MKGCCLQCVSTASVNWSQEHTFSKSWAEALFSGSTFNARCKKSRKTGVKLCSSLIVGVPFVAIKYSARRGDSVRYGGSPSIISIAIIPKLQMSTLRPYSFLVTTSGAIQYGVPTIVFRLLCESLIWAQNPKSAM